MSKHPATGFSPTVSIDFRGCDNPRHGCKKSLLEQGSRATIPANGPHGTADASAVETQPRRTGETFKTHGLLGLLLAALLLFPHHADARCRTHKCWHRVSVHRHIAYAWRWIKAHPMPSCTWIPESGPLSLYGQWSPRRYRVKNTSSTAAGKFQMLDQSAHAAGIPDYPGTHDAAKASRLAQEKAARRLLAIQGRGAWVNC